MTIWDRSFSNDSIYFEAVWVVSLFAATALLRQSLGQLACQFIAHRILKQPFISAHTIDVFRSCSNGARSLGFGASWLMWHLDPVTSQIYHMPLLCWVIGMPIKLAAVTAVRPNAIFGPVWTWVLGFAWILTAILVKFAALFYDRFHGVHVDGRVISYRRIFQSRFCTSSGTAMMFNQDVYDKCILAPEDKTLGITMQWQETSTGYSLSIQAERLA